MKQNKIVQGETVNILHPDYERVVEKFAALGFNCSEQDIYLGKVRGKFQKEIEHVELCYCLNVYNSKKNEDSCSETADYTKKIVCLSYFADNTEVFTDLDILIEKLYPGKVFVYNAGLYQIPQFAFASEPYVLSKADALEMFHKAGFVETKEDDIFIGTFSFANKEARNLACPEAQKHFGVGVSFMINVEVDNISSVAVIRAFNEMIPKTVICTPLRSAVIRRYLPHDSFKTVCGEMALINGVMVNYGKWLKEKLNQIHDSYSKKPRLEFC